MDDAVVEARREEILPGDLLQGITASHFDLSSCYRRTRPAGHHRIISVPVTLSSSTSQPRRFARASNARLVVLVIDLFGQTRPSPARVYALYRRDKEHGKPISLMTIFVEMATTMPLSSRSCRRWIVLSSSSSTHVHRSREKKGSVFASLDICILSFLKRWTGKCSRLLFIEILKFWREELPHSYACFTCVSLVFR